MPDLLIDIYESSLSVDNAIRDMFLSKQYNKKVPLSDMEKVLSSTKWRKLYGKEKLHKAWMELQKDGYVNQEGNFWIWGIK